MKRWIQPWNRTTIRTHMQTDQPLNRLPTRRFAHSHIHKWHSLKHTCEHTTAVQSLCLYERCVLHEYSCSVCCVYSFSAIICFTYFAAAAAAAVSTTKCVLVVHTVAPINVAQLLATVVCILPQHNTTQHTKRLCGLTRLYSLERVCVGIYAVIAIVIFSLLTNVYWKNAKAKSNKILFAHIMHREE